MNAQRTRRNESLVIAGPTRRRALAAVVVSALSWFEASAAAAPSAKEKQQAQALVTEAKKLVQSGALNKALDKLQAAERIAPQSATKVEIAKVQTSLGDLVAALATLQGAARSTTGDQDKRAEIEAKKLLEALDTRTPKLTIEVEKPDADRVQITLDEQATEPGEHRVNPGKHEVVATAKGYARWAKSVRLGEGESGFVSVAMKPSDDAEPHASRGSVPRWAAWTTWGLSAAAIGVGAGFGVMAMNTTDQVRANYGCQGNACPARASEDLDVAKFNGNVSTASFAVGGAGLVTATILTVLAYKKGSETTDDSEPRRGVSRALSARPLLSPGLLGVGGTF
jgi:hypothetical protein